MTLKTERRKYYFLLQGEFFLHEIRIIYRYMYLRCNSITYSALQQNGLGLYTSSYGYRFDSLNLIFMINSFKFF
jgi:hypothetical protein